jgi:MinD-like ATPase involved in chromosome partitioning or flagellar assembly
MMVLSRSKNAAGLLTCSAYRSHQYRVCLVTCSFRESNGFSSEIMLPTLSTGHLFLRNPHKPVDNEVGTFGYQRQGTRMAKTSKLIAVIGSRGGAGTSCLAATVAKAWNDQGQPSVLVDLCGGASGIEVLLGIESEPGARWPQMLDARGEVDGGGVAAALPRWLQVPVLSVSRLDAEALPDEVVLDVCAGLLRNGATVVLDVPQPGAWTPAIRALLSGCDSVLVATVGTLVGLAGAVAVTQAVDKLQRDNLGENLGSQRGLVLRNPKGARVAPGDIKELREWPVLSKVRADRNLDVAVELGAGPVSGASKRLQKAGLDLMKTLESK